MKSNRKLLVLALVGLAALIAIRADATQYSFPTFGSSSKPLLTTDDSAATAGTVVCRDVNGNDIAAVRTATAGLVTQGFLEEHVITESANYTMTGVESVVLVNASGGAVTITEPVDGSNTGKRFMIEKTDSSGNAVTVATQGSDTIQGSTTVTLSSQWSKIIDVADGGTTYVREQ